jgi:hypothetical protein
METPSLNLIDPSFEHALHSYDLHLVPTYKIWNRQFLFYFIFYLLDNHLSSFELRQNNKAHINQCLLLNIGKA